MSGKLSKIICAAAMVTGLAVAGPLLAEPDKIAGSYDVPPMGKPEAGKPACIDHWTLRVDSTLVVQSAQETLRGHWHVENKGKEGEWLVWTGLTTNGLPDCRGKITQQPVDDRRTPFYVNGAGDLVLTEPSAHLADGSYVWTIVGFANKVAEKH